MCRLYNVIICRLSTTFLSLNCRSSSFVLVSSEGLFLFKHINNEVKHFMMSNVYCIYIYVNFCIYKRLILPLSYTRSVLNYSNK